MSARAGPSSRLHRPSSSASVQALHRMLAPSDLEAVQSFVQHRDRLEAKLRQLQESLVDWEATRQQLELDDELLIGVRRAPCALSLFSL